MPLAKATAITFAAPIIVTALAGGFLGGRVSGARWVAVITGFIGVLVITRPGIVALDTGTVALLISTVSMASKFLISKRLTQIETTQCIVAIMTLIPVATGVVPTLLFWRTPSLHTTLFLLVLAGAMFAGRFTMLLALRNAPASTVMPFDLTRLPFITLIAYLAYNELPDALVIVGAMISIFQEELRK